MDSPTTITNTIIPTNCFFHLYFSKSKIDLSTTSKLEILFRLDSGASISVLNLPTYTHLAEKFLPCSFELQSSHSKSTNVAKKSPSPYSI